MSYQCPSCIITCTKTEITFCKDGGTRFCPNCNLPFHIDKKNNIDIHKEYVHECDCDRIIITNYKNIRCPSCDNIFDSDPELDYYRCTKCDDAFFKS